jgi:hypothetical protein
MCRACVKAMPAEIREW